jgi:hypothetical protein
MPRQHGIIKLKGKVGNRLFYKMGGKYFVRTVTAHDVANDPRFAVTHAKGLDFGTACRSAKLLRTALGPAVKIFNKSGLPARLTSHFIKAVAADLTHACGKRQVFAENLASLKDFEFNTGAAFGALGLSPAVSLDLESRTVTLTITAQDLQLTSKRPIPATDTRRLIASVTAINFVKGTHIRHDHVVSLSEATRSGFRGTFPIGIDPDAAIIITLGMTYNAGEELLHTMAVIDVRTAKPTPSSHVLPHRSNTISRGPWTVDRGLPLAFSRLGPRRLRPISPRRNIHLPMKRMHERRRRIIPHHQSDVFDRQTGFFQ